MAAPVAIPAADLDRAVYVAIAGARDDAATDMLAGVAQQILVRQPDVAPVELFTRDQGFAAAPSPPSARRARPISHATARCS